jgi:hypothetical protein
VLAAVAVPSALAVGAELPGTKTAKDRANGKPPFDPARWPKLPLP